MNGSKRRKRVEPKEMVLNISSLMDILTILLLFLILSFDSQEASLKPPEGFDLPDSNSALAVKLAVKITLAMGEVRVEDQTVVKLNKGSFKRQDIDKSKRIKPLLRELQRQKAKLQSGAAAKTEKEEEEAEIVYLECAKGTKFSVLQQVMTTAAEAGFTKFRLAVHRKG